MPDQRDGGITWTDETWNPIVGCSRVSQGCVHCYAEVMAARVANAAQAALRAGKQLTEAQAAYRQVVMWERGGMDAADHDDKALPKWNGRVARIKSRMDEPINWTRPRLVFTNSMSDLFHESMDFSDIDKIVAAMGLAKQHTFQVLTKRPERMAEYLNLKRPAHPVRTNTVLMGDGDRPDVLPMPWPVPNVWWGTSAEDQKTLDDRVQHMLACRPNAAVLWLSLEPLLGPVSLKQYGILSGCDACCNGDRCPGPPECTRYDRLTCPVCKGTANAHVNWVVVGGESGPDARPMHTDWARTIRDECAAAGVPFHHKQNGEWVPDVLFANVERRGMMLRSDGRKPTDEEGRKIMDGTMTTEGWQHMTWVGKKAAGRLLDGRTHDDMPAMPAGRR